MKRAKLTENNFEDAHVAKTLVANGYTKRMPENYNQELFLDAEILLNFVKSTQSAVENIGLFGQDEQGIRR
ncbi:MAG: hypothetical protein AABZ11_00455 [Nitrospinota bacterium]